MKSDRPRPTESCEYCGERLRRERVSVYRQRRRLHVLFKGVPAWVCPGCGHRLFEAAQVEVMEHQLDHPATGRRRAELLIVPA